MPGDRALGAAAVRALDRVDPERQVTSAMDDPGLDDPLGERVVVTGGRCLAGRGLGRG
jgi:hypothetical protein